MNVRTVKWQQIIGIAAVATAALLGAVWALAGSGSPGPTNDQSDRLASLTPADLVRSSEAIVQAQLVAEKRVDVGLVSAADGQVHDHRTDLVRTFQVKSSLKGDPAEGASVDGVSTVANDLAGHGTLSGSHQDYESVPASEQAAYVLFLHRFSDQDGSSPWGFATEPSLARLDGEILNFAATSAYTRQLSESGLKPASSDTAAPFHLGLADLRVLIAQTP